MLPAAKLCYIRYIVTTLSTVCVLHEIVGDTAHLVDIQIFKLMSPPIRPKVF